MRGRRCRDGGYRGRGEGSDLYYTLFAVEALAAWGEPTGDAGLREYLERFGEGEGLDLVHLGCLIRCWRHAADGWDSGRRAAVRERLRAFRTADGGYGGRAGQTRGTVYGAFLAVGAYQDLGVSVPEAGRLAESVGGLELKDGGFGNEAGLRWATTAATAGALAVLRELGGARREETVQWLRGRHLPGGGFEAAAGAGEADLLSTATALHALASARADVGDARESCRRFVESLRTEEGGFRGTKGDGEADCEYTFYGLLALGHLAEGGDG